MNTDSRWCIKHHGYLWISAARQGLLRDWNRLAVRRTNASAITQHGKFSNLFCSLVCFVYRTYAPPSTTRWCLSFSWLHTQISALAICTPYNPCTLRACASSHSKLHVLITPLPLAHFAPTQSTIIPDPPVTGRDDKAESTGRVPRLCARKTMYQTQAKRTAREA
jgi:hypothetical protein